MSAKLDLAIQANTVSNIILEVIDRAELKVKRAAGLPADDAERALLMREAEALTEEAKILSERIAGYRK